MVSHLWIPFGTNILEGSGIHEREANQKDILENWKKEYIYRSCIFLSRKFVVGSFFSSFFFGCSTISRGVNFFFFKSSEEKRKKCNFFEE